MPGHWKDKLTSRPRKSMKEVMLPTRAQPLGVVHGQESIINGNVVDALGGPGAVEKILAEQLSARGAQGFRLGTHNMLLAGKQRKQPTLPQPGLGGTAMGQGVLGTPSQIPTFNAPTATGPETLAAIEGKGIMPGSQPPSGLGGQSIIRPLPGYPGRQPIEMPKPPFSWPTQPFDPREFERERFREFVKDPKAYFDKQKSLRRAGQDEFVLPDVGTPTALPGLEGDVSVAPSAGLTDNEKARRITAGLARQGKSQEEIDSTLFRAGYAKQLDGSYRFVGAPTSAPPGDEPVTPIPDAAPPVHMTAPAQTPVGPEVPVTPPPPATGLGAPPVEPPPTGEDTTRGIGLSRLTDIATGEDELARIRRNRELARLGREAAARKGEFRQQAAQLGFSAERIAAGEAAIEAAFGQERATLASGLAETEAERQQRAAETLAQTGLAGQRFEEVKRRTENDERWGEYDRLIRDGSLTAAGDLFQEITGVRPDMSYLQTQQSQVTRAGEQQITMGDIEIRAKEAGLTRADIDDIARWAEQFGDEFALGRAEERGLKLSPEDLAIIRRTTEQRLEAGEQALTMGDIRVKIAKRGISTQDFNDLADIATRLGVDAAVREAQKRNVDLDADDFEVIKEDTEVRQSLARMGLTATSEDLDGIRLRNKITRDEHSRMSTSRDGSRVDSAFKILYTAGNDNWKSADGTVDPTAMKSLSAYWKSQGNPGEFDPNNATHEKWATNLWNASTANTIDAAVRDVTNSDWYGKLEGQDKEDMDAVLNFLPGFAVTEGVRVLRGEKGSAFVDADGNELWKSADFKAKPGQQIGNLEEDMGVDFSAETEGLLKKYFDGTNLKVNKDNWTKYADVLRAIDAGNVSAFSVSQHDRVRELLDAGVFDVAVSPTTGQPVNVTMPTDGMRMAETVQRLVGDSGMRGKTVEIVSGNKKARVLVGKDGLLFLEDVDKTMDDSIRQFAADLPKLLKRNAKKSKSGRRMVFLGLLTGGVGLTAAGLAQ